MVNFLASETMNNQFEKRLQFGALVYFASALLSPELYAIALLGLLIPTLAAAVRRLHDGGRSGSNLLWAFVPIGGIVVFIWLASTGERAPNRFG